MIPYGDTESALAWMKGLLPDGTKPLARPMLAYRHWAPVACIWEQLYM